SMSRKMGVALAGAFLLLATAARADLVTDWNAVTLDAIRVDKTPPPKAARALACVHAAVFDAVNGAAGGSYTPYLVQPIHPLVPISPEAAAAAAAHDVLVDLFRTQAATFDAALATSLAQVPDGPEKTGGISWGQSVAQQILELRHDDGSGTTVGYEAPAGANWWIPTPPAFAPALLPNWPYVKPWAMANGAQLR